MVFTRTRDLNRKINLDFRMKLCLKKRYVASNFASSNKIPVRPNQTNPDLTQMDVSKNGWYLFPPIYTENHDQPVDFEGTNMFEQPKPCKWNFWQRVAKWQQLQSRMPVPLHKCDRFFFLWQTLVRLCLKGHARQHSLSVASEALDAVKLHRIWLIFHLISLVKLRLHIFAVVLNLAVLSQGNLNLVGLLADGGQNRNE